MTNVWFALGLTVFAGLATGVGSAMAFFAKRANYRFLSVSTGFSAGVMLYVSFARRPAGLDQATRLIFMLLLQHFRQLSWSDPSQPAAEDGKAGRHWAQFRSRYPAACGGELHFSLRV